MTGQQLKQQRQDAGLTLRELARRTSVNYVAIHRHETGAHTLHPLFLRAIKQELRKAQRDRAVTQQSAA